MPTQSPLSRPYRKIRVNRVGMTAVSSLVMDYLDGKSPDRDPYVANQEKLLNSHLADVRFYCGHPPPP